MSTEDSDTKKLSDYNLIFAALKYDWGIYCEALWIQ